jgi:regulator of replication initiation timing
LENLESKLNIILNQIKKLKIIVNEFRDKSSKLELENEKLKESINNKTLVIEKLLKEKKVIINAKSLNEIGTSSKETRYKINELIRGIDKCISQLNL